MSVATHLDLTPAAYDEKIRTLIPLYDELIAASSAAVALATRPVEQIVEFGIGTGALTHACLTAAGSRTCVWGIDADADMTAMVPVRLGARLARRVTLTHGNFEQVSVPPCDAITATYALHHIRTARAKQQLYRRCFAALRPGGILVNGDCAPASTPRGFARDLEVWFAHLGRSFGGRAQGKRVYESWAGEDFYLPLADEIRLLTRAGFTVDIPWRRSPFAVIAALKPAV